MIGEDVRMLLLVALLAMMPSPPGSEPIQLFNGKDMTRWEHVGPGRFVLENGLLKSEGGMGLLWYTGRKFGDGTLRVVYKTTNAQTNSGVFIRIPEKPTEPWMPVNRGYEVQILDDADDFHSTGVLYSLTKARARPGKAGDWNTMEITLDGPHTVVRVNGEIVTDYREGDPVPPKQKGYEPDRGRRPDEGYIGLQNHAADATIYFKEVSFTPAK
jgi:Domain of Unknown Function (DUF1080)